MPIMTWNEALSVHIESLDDQHRQLVGLINELHDAMKQGQGRQIVGSIIDRLAAYTQQHFTAEELLFEQHDYPAKAGHKREHNTFIENVADFRNKFNKGHLMLSMEVMTFLKEWLVNHIQVSDKKYSPFLNAKGLA